MSFAKSRSMQEKHLKHDLDSAYRTGKISMPVMHNVLLRDLIPNVPTTYKVNKKDEDFVKFVTYMINFCHPCSVKELLAKVPKEVHPSLFECDFVTQDKMRFLEIDDIFHYSTIGENGVKNLAAILTREYVKKKIVENAGRQFNIVMALDKSSNEIKDDSILALTN